MKFTFIEDFTLEVGDTVVLKGTFKELSKSEMKEQKAKQKELLDMSKEATKLSSRLTFLEQKKNIKEKLGDWKSVEATLEEIHTLTNDINEKLRVLNEGDREEEIYKSRLEMSLGGEQVSNIMDLGEEYGYKRVFDTIQKDIEEKKGNDEKAS